MATLRDLKVRIGSVASSEKITGAMKMISSAKMHKAEGILRRLLPYKGCVQSIITNLLSSDAVVESPLTEAHNTVSKIAILVFGSDDGLCGAYNVNIFKGLLAQIALLREKYGDNVIFEIIPVGKKVAKAIAKITAADHKIVINAQDDVNSKSEGETVKRLGENVQQRFLNGELDEVKLVYMHFQSAGRQILTTQDYLPIHQSSLVGEKNAKEESSKLYIFEPDVNTIFSTVLPMFLLSQLQEAFAENRASEQAARVMAMQSANDNAVKLLEQLRLEYNKLRQQSITTELLDIVGGQTRD